MPLKLMYITNNPEVAEAAEANGVDRIFVDMEYIGKSERQGGMDTVQNYHTVEDVANIRVVLKSAELMVRCNPIHEKTDNYGSSAEEINEIIKAGADYVMLPYFKTVDEVESFINMVGGRAKTILLFETPEAVAQADKILSIKGIDEVFIGLNDLGLGYGKKFMFELLADGTVESLCRKFEQKGIPYGFGGVASLGKGMLPSEYIIAEHYRLGSTCAILSRSFCNVTLIKDIEGIRSVFSHELKKIRNHENYCFEQDAEFFFNNAKMVRLIVDDIVKDLYIK